MRVYLVEDSVLVRDRLAALLWTMDGIELVGEAENASDAVTGVSRTQPDVLVLDLELDGGTGLHVLRQLQTWPEAPSTIVLTNYATPEIRRKCLETGARYFFDKTTEFSRLKDALADLAQERGQTDQH